MKKTVNLGLGKSLADIKRNKKKNKPKKRGRDDLAGDSIMNSNGSFHNDTDLSTSKASSERVDWRNATSNKD